MKKMHGTYSVVMMLPASHDRSHFLVAAETSQAARALGAGIFIPMARLASSVSDRLHTPENQAFEVDARITICSVE
jgi:hypothetical protein